PTATTIAGTKLLYHPARVKKLFFMRAFFFTPAAKIISLGISDEKPIQVHAMFPPACRCYVRHAKSYAWLSQASPAGCLRYAHQSGYPEDTRRCCAGHQTEHAARRR